MWNLFSKKEKEEEPEQYVVRLITTKGIIEADLFTEEMPITTAHFMRIAQSGFYNGLQFFRYIPEILIQTGCPYNNGMGTAAHFGHIAQESCKIPLEEGVFAMPHTAPHMIGSQFFICLSQRGVAHLEGACPAFAKITSDITVLSRLRAGDLLEKVEIITIKPEEKEGGKEEGKEEGEEESE
ncbi:MAG: peptidylprolyl isomerase [Cytophagales bacterium]|nr:peptidylprolyl isomerase [Cytophagales bacterium]